MIRTNLISFQNNLLLIVLIFFFSQCNSSKKEKGYYDNGALHYEVPLKDGKRNGTLYQYFKNGQLQLKSSWEEGLKDGYAISYHENEKIHTEEMYNNDKAHGVFKVYDSLGSLIEKVTYKNGEPDGQYIGFYPDGDTMIIANYKNGKKHNRATLFHEDNYVKEKRIYDNDTLKYSVSFTKDTAFFNSILPINVSMLNPDTISIHLEHSFYDSTRIGVIFGHLDNENHLIDTLEVTGNIGQTIYHKISPKIISKGGEITGVLFKIDMSDELIKGQMPFRYKLGLN